MLHRACRYERAKEEVGKWQPLVKAHREAPTLSFLAGRGDAGRPSTTAALVAAQVRAQPDQPLAAPCSLAARHSLQGKGLPAPSATAALVAVQVLAQPGSAFGGSLLVGCSPYRAGLMGAITEALWCVAWHIPVSPDWKTTNNSHNAGQQAHCPAVSLPSLVA